MVPRFRVLIAEDNDGVAAALAEQLSDQPAVELVGIAANGREACERAAELRPDVVLMDIDMPEMDGVAATRWLRLAQPATQVVMLTIHDDTPRMLEAIRAGAMSYLIKGCETREIVREIRAVMAGEGSIPPAQAGAIQVEFREYERRAAALRHLYETLSRSEIAVLECVAQGMTNTQIASRQFIELTTVKGHITSILRKLHVMGRQEAAAIAERSGLAG